MSTVTYVGALPDCDWCSQKKLIRTARFDFKTFMGPWSFGCDEHYHQYRMSERLGKGLGQRLVLEGEE